ncbi:unnamed protein product [Sphagnum troendelagicum]
MFSSLRELLNARRVPVVRHGKVSDIELNMFSLFAYGIKTNATVMNTCADEILSGSGKAKMFSYKWKPIAIGWLHKSKPFRVISEDLGIYELEENDDIEFLIFAEMHPDGHGYMFNIKHFLRIRGDSPGSYAISQCYVPLFSDVCSISYEGSTTVAPIECVDYLKFNFSYVHAKLLADKVMIVIKAVTNSHVFVDFSILG